MCICLFPRKQITVLSILCLAGVAAVPDEGEDVQWVGGAVSSAVGVLAHWRGGGSEGGGDQTEEWVVADVSETGENLGLNVREVGG